VKKLIHRREFITASTAVAAGLSFGAGSSAAETPLGPPGGDRTTVQGTATPAAPLERGGLARVRGGGLGNGDGHGCLVEALLFS
jgi:hypothetical protein